MASFTNFSDTLPNPNNPIAYDGSSNSDNPEVTRINCEAEMTSNRVNELRQKIYYLES